MHGTFPIHRAAFAPQPAFSVLLMEKHGLARDALALVLEEQGVSFIEADSGPEALALLLRQPCRVLLTNLSLDGDGPAQTGRDLADQARQLRPDLAVIYTCGLPTCPDRSLEPWERLLRKPFTTAQMMRVLNELLAFGAQAERNLANA